MRLKHGLQGTSTAPTSPEVLEALTALLELGTRLESRLKRLETAFSSVEQRYLRPGEEGAEVHALRAELAEVLSAIDREKSKARALQEIPPALPRTLRQTEALRATHDELGTLRRRQFEILFLLGEKAPGAQQVNLGDTGHF